MKENGREIEQESVEIKRDVEEDENEEKKMKLMKNVRAKKKGEARK